MRGRPLPERLPARPVRHWLLAWHLWTGDPPRTIATGFGLDPDVVEELLGTEPPLMISLNAAHQICAGLRCQPRAFWGQPPDDPESDPWLDLPSAYRESFALARAADGRSRSSVIDNPSRRPTD